VLFGVRHRGGGRNASGVVIAVATRRRHHQEIRLGGIEANVGVLVVEKDVEVAGLVFVDGSHAYDYAKTDSATAFRLAKPGAMVIWHDYGVWPGVTRALEELEASQKLGLKHIRGTSLVFWRAPAAR